MIKVEKDFSDVPEILNSQNRKEAFLKNIEDGAFNHGIALYKPSELKTRLHNIYNLKCVYCEEKLLDAPKHIEHYRPKDIYYWLAYSWDNLLLSCGSCNSSKGSAFEIRGNQKIYNDESFEDLHNLSTQYDIDEEPMIINPEKDDVLNEIIFDKDALISSLNDRVTHTIDIACKLNRDELVQRRKELLNDFINIVDEYTLLFNKDSQIDKKEQISFFIPVVKSFINKCHIEKEFYSFKYFIIHNIEIFIEDESMQKIVKSIIEKINE